MNNLSNRLFGAWIFCCIVFLAATTVAIAYGSADDGYWYITAGLLVITVPAIIALGWASLHLVIKGDFP